MKRSIIAILAASTLSLAAAAYAGGHGHHGKHGGFGGGMHRFMLEQQLDLTSEQEAAIDEIYSAAKEQRKETSADRSDVRQAMMDLSPADPDYQTKVNELAKQMAAQVEQKILSHAAAQAQVYELLTPEQREELAELKEKLKERFAERRQHFDRDSE